MRHEVLVGAAFWFLVSAFVAFSAGHARGDGLGDSRQVSLSSTPASPPQALRTPSEESGLSDPRRGSLSSAPASPSRELRNPSSDGAEVDETWQQFRGRVLFSDILFAPPADFPSPGARAASLKRNGRNAVQSTGGFWRLHCVAFLNPVPKAGGLVVRATDVTTPAKRQEVRVFHATLPAGQKEVSLDDLVLTDTMGFLQGHRYEISVEHDDDDLNVPPTGKRDVYAKGVVTLM